MLKWTSSSRQKSASVCKGEDSNTSTDLAGSTKFFKGRKLDNLKSWEEYCKSSHSTIDFNDVTDLNGGRDTRKPRSRRTDNVRSPSSCENGSEQSGKKRKRRASSASLPSDAAPWRKSAEQLHQKKSLMSKVKRIFRRSSSKGSVSKERKRGSSLPATPHIGDHLRQINSQYREKDISLDELKLKSKSRLARKMEFMKQQRKFIRSLNDKRDSDDRHSMLIDYSPDKRERVALYLKGQESNTRDSQFDYDSFNEKQIQFRNTKRHSTPSMGSSHGNYLTEKPHSKGNLDSRNQTSARQNSLQRSNTFNSIMNPFRHKRWSVGSEGSIGLYENHVVAEPLETPSDSESIGDESFISQNDENTFHSDEHAFDKKADNKKSTFKNLDDKMSNIPLNRNFESIESIVSALEYENSLAASKSAGGQGMVKVMPIDPLKLIQQRLALTPPKDRGRISPVKKVESPLVNQENRCEIDNVSFKPISGTRNNNNGHHKKPIIPNLSEEAQSFPDESIKSEKMSQPVRIDLMSCLPKTPTQVKPVGCSYSISDSRERLNILQSPQSYCSGSPPLICETKRFKDTPPETPEHGTRIEMGSWFDDAWTESEMSSSVHIAIETSPPSYRVSSDKLSDLTDGESAKSSISRDNDNSSNLKTETFNKVKENVILKLTNGRTDLSIEPMSSGKDFIKGPDGNKNPRSVTLPSLSSAGSSWGSEVTSSREDKQQQVPFGGDEIVVGHNRSQSFINESCASELTSQSTRRTRENSISESLKLYSISLTSQNDQNFDADDNCQDQRKEVPDSAENRDGLTKTCYNIDTKANKGEKTEGSDLVIEVDREDSDIGGINIPSDLLSSSVTTPSDSDTCCFSVKDIVEVFQKRSTLVNMEKETRPRLNKTARYINKGLEKTFKEKSNDKGIFPVREEAIFDNFGKMDQVSNKQDDINDGVKKNNFEDISINEENINKEIKIEDNEIITKEIDKHYQGEIIPILCDSSDAADKNELVEERYNLTGGEEMSPSQENIHLHPTSTADRDIDITDDTVEVDTETKTLNRPEQTDIDSNDLHLGGQSHQCEVKVDDFEGEVIDGEEIQRSFQLSDISAVLDSAAILANCELASGLISISNTDDVITLSGYNQRSHEANTQTLSNQKSHDANTQTLSNEDRADKILLVPGDVFTMPEAALIEFDHTCDIINKTKKKVSFSPEVTAAYISPPDPTLDLDPSVSSDDIAVIDGSSIPDSVQQERTKQRDLIFNTDLVKTETEEPAEISPHTNSSQKQLPPVPIDTKCIEKVDPAAENDTDISDFSSLTENNDPKIKPVEDSNKLDDNLGDKRHGFEPAVQPESNGKRDIQTHSCLSFRDNSFQIKSRDLSKAVNKELYGFLDDSEQSALNYDFSFGIESMQSFDEWALSKTTDSDKIKFSSLVEEGPTREADFQKQEEPFENKKVTTDIGTDPPTAQDRIFISSTFLNNQKVSIAAEVNKDERLNDTNSDDEIPQSDLSCTSSSIVGDTYTLDNQTHIFPSMFEPVQELAQDLSKSKAKYHPPLNFKEASTQYIPSEVEESNKKVDEERCDIHPDVDRHNTNQRLKVNPPVSGKMFNANESGGRIPVSGDLSCKIPDNETYTITGDTNVKVPPRPRSKLTSLNQRRNTCGKEDYNCRNILESSPCTKSSDDAFYQSAIMSLSEETGENGAPNKKIKMMSTKYPAPTVNQGVQCFAYPLTGPGVPIQNLLRHRLCDYQDKESPGVLIENIKGKSDDALPSGNARISGSSFRRRGRSYAREESEYQDLSHSAPNSSLHDLPALKRERRRDSRRHRNYRDERESTRACARCHDHDFQSGGGEKYSSENYKRTELTAFDSNGTKGRNGDGIRRSIADRISLSPRRLNLVCDQPTSSFWGKQRAQRKSANNIYLTWPSSNIPEKQSVTDKLCGHIRRFVEIISAIHVPQWFFLSIFFLFQFLIGWLFHK